jgi:cell filamentation protein
MAFDPFGDAATRGYLRNFAGASDPAIVKRLEYRAFRENVGRALDMLAGVNVIAYDDVLATHRVLFGSVYPWAGEDRTQHAPDIAISKGGRSDLFAHPQDVRMACEYALREGRSREVMANRPGFVMGLLAHAHPFLDGNGRTIMVVHTELAHRAGRRIDWHGVEKGAYLAALTRELEAPGQRYLDDYLQPFLQRATGRRIHFDTLKALPGLGGHLDGGGEANSTDDNS